MWGAAFMVPHPGDRRLSRAGTMDGPEGCGTVAEDGDKAGSCLVSPHMALLMRHGSLLAGTSCPSRK